MAIIQPKTLETLSHYGDLWHWDATRTLPDGNTEQVRRVVVNEFTWRGYQILDDGTPIADVRPQHPAKWQVWREYYTVEFAGQQLRLETAETAKDKRVRLFDGDNQVVAEYAYDQQNQPVALLVRGTAYPTGAGWNDRTQAHRFINDSAGRPLLRVRLKPHGKHAHNIDLLQPVADELVVVASVFAGLIKHSKPSSEAALTYQPLDLQLFDLPELVPGVIDCVRIPLNRPQKILLVKQQQLLATIAVQRKELWGLGKPSFELQTAGATYFLQKPPTMAREGEHLTDQHGTTVALRTIEKDRKKPIFVYRDQQCPIKGDWLRGAYREVYDAAGKLLLLICVSQDGVESINIYQPVVAGLPLAAAMIALTHTYSSSDSGSSV